MNLIKATFASILTFASGHSAINFSNLPRRNSSNLGSYFFSAITQRGPISSSLIDLTSTTSREEYVSAFQKLQRQVRGPLMPEQLCQSVILSEEGTWAYVQSFIGNDLSPTVKTNACFNTTGIQSGQRGINAEAGASVEKLINLKHDASLVDQRITLLLGAPSFVLRQICRHMMIKRQFLPQETAQALVQHASQLALLKGELLHGVPRPNSPIHPAFMPLHIRTNKGKGLKPNKQKLFIKMLQASNALTEEHIQHLQEETNIPAWFWAGYKTSGDYLYLRMTFSPKELTGLVMERLFNKHVQEETRNAVGLLSAIFQTAYPRTTAALLQRSKEQLILDSARQELDFLRSVANK